MRPVEDHPYGGPPGVVEREEVLDARALPESRVVDALLRDAHGRLEAEAFQEEGIGEEAQQVRGVPHAAVAQVFERLGHHAARRRGERGELRVGLGLPAEGQERNLERGAAAAQLLETLRPGAPTAKESNHHRPRPQKGLLEEGAGVG
jgi:hypothetical protein